MICGALVARYCQIPNVRNLFLLVYIKQFDSLYTQRDFILYDNRRYTFADGY